MPTILVADDNSNIQKMVTSALKDQGISVVAVGNGEAAVRKLPDLRPDVVLADIFMPVRNGYEVCEFVKRDERFAHIPVVLLVGAFDPLDEHEVGRVHADGVLKKPFVPPDPLIAMVKSLLEKGPGVSAAPAMASAMFEASSAQKMEKTQQLTPEEIAAVTHQPPPAPEPEPEQFAPQPIPLAIDEEHAPVAFRDMMEVEEEQQEEKEAGADTGEEEEEEEPEFEASSVSGFHLPGESEAAPAEAHEAGEAAHEEADHWASIKEEQKHPDAEQPPIPVEFGASEPVELITQETGNSMAHVEVRPDPALVSSPAEWMNAPPPMAPATDAEHEPEFEPMRLEAESAEPVAHEAEPAHFTGKTGEDTQQFFAPSGGTEKPLESLAQDLHEEAARATPPPDAMEETQQFMAPAGRTPEPVPPEPAPLEHPPASPPAATWGRLEEAMLPAAPLVAEAAAEFHARADERAHTESAPPAAAAPASDDTGTESDPLVWAISQKVMDQLDAKTLEKLTRELVRPLIEALIRREIDRD